MSIKVLITDEVTGTSPIVTKSGQLVTGEIDFSTFYTATAGTDNVAVNLVPPKAGMNFIITAIVLSANRNVGANGAVVDLFENSVGPTDGTVAKQIFQDEIAKQTRATLTGLNIKVTAAHWVNIKTDDDDVRGNIAGYYTATV